MAEPERDDGLALYVHIPFCGQRCAYCHFEIKVFHPKTEPAPFYRQYVTYLTRELGRLAELHGERRITSVFYGGGTPSRLPLSRLEAIQNFIARTFRLDADCEISMEANPEDIDRTFLEGIRGFGINRCSLGIQTFDDRGLKAVKRPHDGAQAVRAAAAVKECGFPKGFSLDLIIGLPFQDHNVLLRDLRQIESLAPDHVSLYMLERDLPTPLDKAAKGLALPSEDEQADSYETVADFLCDRGYRHYEISNFAKPGFECRHNLTYWTCGDYLGAGPAAHGRVGLEYRANHAGLRDYLRAVAATGIGVAREERWSRERFRQERIIGGLRLDQGIPAGWPNAREHAALRQYEEAGLVCRTGERLRLTGKGRLLANEVFQVFVG